MNMFSYYITTFFITSNKDYNSCRNLHSVYQTYLKPNKKQTQYIYFLLIFYVLRLQTTMYKTKPSPIKALLDELPHLQILNLAQGLRPHPSFIRESFAVVIHQGIICCSI